jgi:hypothetical protein
MYIGAFSASTWASAITPPSDILQPHIFAATHKSGEQKMYFNRALVATGTVAETPALASNAGIGPGDGGSVAGYVYMVAVWNRVLNESEILKLNDNPWQLFAPRRVIIPSAAAAAGIYTLSNATYAPGSLTATAVTPRVTVTVT